MDNVNELMELYMNASLPLQIAIGTVAVLILICAIVSIVISIWLAISYVKFNKKQNSANMNGETIARKILDDNGLEHIKVKCSGSILFGNSYSHYFKKVRLRRRTWKKESVSSLAMASQKSCLAILDKENDPDMKTRIKLTPVIYFGPVFLIPLVAIGVVLDIVIGSTDGVCTAVAASLGMLIYVVSFIMSLMVLKTEKKAQERAYEVVRASSLATEEEIADMKSLFKLYNIEYVNDMIMSLLELIMRILMIILKAESKGNVSTSKD